MLTYPDLDPVVVAIGPLKVHWYGLMYLFGFSVAWMLARWRGNRAGWSSDQVDDLIFYGVIGTIIGGRLGYMLFYGLTQILDNPLNLFKVWEGGMSFHGGLIGVLLAIWFFAHRQRWHFFQVADFVAPLVPPGLFAGRLGNFINGELWGQRTDLPWGMRLPCAQFPGQCADQPAAALWSPPVHPSQLYEAALEGMVLLLILWFFSQRPRPMMAVSGVFLIGYGSFRCVVEFVRLPDAHIGYVAFDWLTMGQLLTLPMMVSGAVLLALAYRRRAIS